MMCPQTLRLCFLALALFFPAPETEANQTYPVHPIKLLVGGASGSVPDIMIRPVADRLAAALGQPVLVVNRPGAAGSIAIDAMLQSPPDGYTLALATMSQAVFNTYLFARLPYDPLRDFEPITPLVTGAMTIATHPSFPAASLQDLVRVARKEPGRLLMAMPQAGSPPHVIGLLLSRFAELHVTFVPHKAAPEAVNAVVGNEIPLLIDAPTVVSPLVTAGRLKALVVTGSQREAALPGVPTAAESGFPGLEGEAWIGLVAPAGTPANVVDRLHRELSLILGSPDMEALMARLSFRSMTRTPAEFRALIRSEHQKWSGVIRSAGLRLD